MLKKVLFVIIDNHPSFEVIQLIEERPRVESNVIQPTIGSSDLSAAIGRNIYNYRILRIYSIKLSYALPYL